LKEQRRGAVNDFDTNSKVGLGRGLDALIPDSSDTVVKGATTEVAINMIDVNPHQPRSVFNEEDLHELSSSIKKHGILQPLVVSPKDDHFELIAGERRLRAAKLAGLTKVPVVVRDADDHQKLEIAIIENVHRSNLNPIDEALSYRKLVEEFNYTQDQVSDAVGKPRTSVANKIRLLGLPSEIKKAIKEGKISEGHAKALLSVTDPRKLNALFEAILADDLNVREVEKKAKLGDRKEKINGNTENDLAVKQLADDLKNYLGTKVSVKNGRKGGKIEIDYYSTEELARIYQKIKGIE
jgi:ParB family chromosome partitioning protein